jgi:PAS domain S-box-containing protein
MDQMDRLFQQILERVPDALYVYDLSTGTTSYINSRARDVLGYSAADVTERGSRFGTELWHPDDAAKLPEHRRRLQLLRDGETHETEYRVRQPGGGYRWLRSRTVVFARDAKGAVRQIVGSVQDITTMKSAEDALYRSEERFRSYFDLGLIGMAITSPTTGIVQVNDEICRILGYDRAELLRLNWPAITHPDDLAADVAQFRRVAAGEIDRYALDKRWIRKNGSTVWSTISVGAVRRQDRSICYFVALLQDITDRKQAEQALVRARDELEGRVAARTSELTVLNRQLLEYQQELRNLTARLIDVQEAQTRSLARELHDEVSQQLAAIGVAVAGVAQTSGTAGHATLMRVVEDINRLAFNVHRVSRQLHPAILEDLGLPAALQSECFAFTEQYGLAAEFESFAVPQSVPHDVALCLYRIAQESLRNAGKHAGGTTVHVTLRGTDGELTLLVEDRGVGFDRDIVKDKRGLGLVSMEERVRLVGGTLAVTSRPGAGTRIVARVPLITSASD